MVSIIICSVNPVDLSRITENIAATVGVEFELLVWDNRISQTGLCEVYNSLAAKAKFDYFIFMHEDIQFTTHEWGRNLLSFFELHPKAGVAGVAGSKYKSALFSGWYTGIKEFDCATIIHRYSYGDEAQLLKPGKELLPEEVVCLDGVFICCKRSVWELTKFDQLNLRGFHFYDIDFTLRTSKLCSLAVVYDIGIIHITKGGDFGNKWVDTAINYHLRKVVSMPCSCAESSNKNIDKIIAKTWLDVLKNYEVSWRNKWRWISCQKLYSKPYLYYSIAKFIFYRPFGVRRLHKITKQK